MKLAIIGSRTFSNYALVDETFKRYFATYKADTSTVGWLPNVDEIISGGAKGADTMGAILAGNWGLKLTEFIPDWDRHGKKAGFIRNEDIVKASDFVLCFWDGQSRGAGNSLSIAKRLKKPTLIIYF